MRFVLCKRNKDGYAWRCMNRLCSLRKQYFSLRKGSFFEKFTVSMRFILKVIVMMLAKQSQYSVCLFFNSHIKSVRKIFVEFNKKIPEPDFREDKFGGCGTVVQIDETMLNYKCKSHRGRSPENRTDSLCIVECRNSITKAFACIIPNKKKKR